LGSKSFKDNLKELCSEWLFIRDHILTPPGKKKSIVELLWQQLPWRRLYRGGKPPEDGCMKPKHVV
jgi:hypothetical protein